MTAPAAPGSPKPRPLTPAQRAVVECPLCEGTGIAVCHDIGFDDEPYYGDCRRCRGNGYVALSPEPSDAR